MTVVNRVFPYYVKYQELGGSEIWVDRDRKGGPGHLTDEWVPVQWEAT